MSLPNYSSVIPNNHVKINIVISSTLNKMYSFSDVFRASFIRVTEKDMHIIAE